MKLQTPSDLARLERGNGGASFAVAVVTESFPHRLRELLAVALYPHATSTQTRRVVDALA